MVSDDIVIGSGLAALGVVLGLPAGRRVLVIGGPAQGTLFYYDGSRTIPCAMVGHGGLGQYWHGVLATGGRIDAPAAYRALARRFFPHTGFEDKLGHPWLFVPWRPIRPVEEWRRLLAERGERLQLAYETVTRFAIEDGRVSVHTPSGRHEAKRVWVAAGALHTPRLLGRSLEARLARETVSDHVICYLGQVELKDVQPTRVERTRDGVWFSAFYDETGSALCTLRPARFGFRQLDYGIEQRAVFGLPTGSAIQKILKRASPGLVAEALYNRTGLLPGAALQSLYAQVRVPDALGFRDGATLLEVRHDVIRKVTDSVRARPPLPGLRASQRPEMFIPAIHLHHSVDMSALQALGLDRADAPVQVVDASVQQDIGPDHHSFKIMLAASERARALSA